MTSKTTLARLRRDLARFAPKGMSPLDAMRALALWLRGAGSPGFALTPDERALLERAICIRRGVKALEPGEWERLEASDSLGLQDVLLEGGGLHGLIEGRKMETP